jgi:hypothetical protein
VLPLLVLAILLCVPSIAEGDSVALVSSGPGGGSGSYVDFYSVSQDGSTAIFGSTDQLVGADTDSQLDVYARTGQTTTLVSTGPSGGNGAFPASFGGISQDASRVFFQTQERLVAADTDDSLDLYEHSAGTTTLVSTGPNGGNGAYDAYFAGVSQDGSRVFFQTSEQLVSGDTDSAQDLYERSGGATTLLSTGSGGGNGPFPADYAGSTPDGSHLFFHTNEQLVGGDSDSAQDVYDRSGGTTTLVSSGSTGGNGAFSASFEGASDDGSRVFFITEESLVSGDTDALQDVYQRSGGTTTLLSTGPAGGNGQRVANFAGSSSDGSHVFIETQEKLVAADVDGFIDVYDRTSSATTLISPGLNDNNGATNAYFVATSQNGSTAFIRTDESLTAADNDGYQDVYQVSGGTTTLLSVGPTGGNAAVNVLPAGASADGSRVFFETYEPLVASDTDSTVDVYERNAGATTLLTQGPAGGNGAFDARFEGMSQNGGRVFFHTNESLLSGDGDSAEDLYSSDLGGRVVVVKDAQPDDPQDFTFTIGGGLSLGLTAPPGQTTFQLDDDSDPALSNARTIDDVTPGSGYSVAETVPSGWDQTGATCSDGSPASNIDVSAGETVTCTFTNRKRGQIVVVEDSQPNDPQDFSFTAGGGLSPSSFQLDDDSDGTLSNTRTFNDLTPGSGYSLSETVPSGWDQTGATCDDGSPISNVDVSAGETVTCTFTNRKRGTIVILKDAQPDNPQDFSFTVGGGLSPSTFKLDDDNNSMLSNTQTFSNVTPGSGYSASETVPSGWDQSSATCDNGSPVSNINVQPGQTVTCTFVNKKRGGITVVKDAQPNDPQDFSFTAGGGLSPSSFALDDDSDPTLSNTRTFSNIQAGSGYSLSETVPSGWDQSSATCDNGSPVSNINVQPGQTVTCTFVNAKRARITIVKDAQPDDPQDFTFNATNLSPSFFTLDDDPPSSTPNTQTYNNVLPGSGYSVTENVPSGWDQSSATCSDGSPVANINLSAGEQVTCTFVNQQRGSITIFKDAQPNSAQDFSFTAAGGLSPTSFQLDDDSDPTLPNAQVFQNIPAASGYSVAESVPTGWVQSSATCSDGSALTNISISPGEDVVCTFTNKKRGTIVAVKDAQPNDPQDFSFTAGGGLSPSSFQLDDDSNGTLSNTRTFNDVTPGSGYSLSETVPSGWDQTGATCSDGSPVSNIDVAAGETVTCTFTNDKRGTIVAVKDAQPNDPQDFSFTAGGGLSPSSFQLDADSDGTLTNSNTFANVPPGSGYSLSETVPSGWDQTGATCDDGSPVSDIDVSAGETVTCTFTNRKQGTIVVVKDTVPDDAEDFSFSAGGGLSPSSFQLDDDSDPGLPNTQTFTDVAPGSGYSVSESVPPGWIQAGATCDDGSPVSDIDVSAGETVTCTFLNSHAGFPRPKGATPVLVALVPAYRSCDSPNREHGLPLNSPSCNPPAQASDYLTVGTLDANGKAANSSGRMRFDVKPGNGSTPENEADVPIQFDLSDVRNRSDLSDYTGELSAAVVMRITDKQNGPFVNEPGTVADMPLSATVQCSATSDTAIGAACSVDTTVNSLIPGAVVESKRSIWQLTEVQVFDGGADGAVSTADNTLFEHQGIFAP